MFDLMLNSFIVIAVVVIATIVLSSFADKFKLVDIPNHRKYHSGKIPLVGGISMFIGFVSGGILLASEYIQIMSMTLTLFIMLVIGIIDDISDMKATSRIFLQVVMAVFIVSVLGVELHSLGNLFNTGNIVLGDFSLIITVLAIVGVVNSYNVIDGIDGLAAGIAFIVFSSILLLTYMEQSYKISFLSFVYLIVLFVFFFFNLSSKYKVFMGDNGTLFIGMSIVWMLIVLTQGELAVFSPVLALWIYAIPLIDILSVAILRMKLGKSPFLADTSHIHFQMKNRFNISERKVLCVILSISAAFAMLGILGHIYKIPEWVMLFGFVGFFILYLVDFLRFNTLKNRVNLNI